MAAAALFSIVGWLGRAALLVMAVESVGNMSEYEKNGREADKKER